MDISNNLEIHFHEQDKGSVFLENTSSGEDEKFSEILLFCLFAVRTMVNLGNNNLGYSVAVVLNDVCKKYDIFLTFLDRYNDSEAKLVDYKGSEGRKRFFAELQVSDNNFKFHYQTKGFGFLAKGIGYYAPNSVLLLLRHLSNKRRKDEDYIKRLASAAYKCGDAFLKNVINIRNQGEIAMMIAAQHSDPEASVDKLFD